ncbi:MAG: hypothetical protein LUD46_17180 [Parabacteroides sp.]|nr:hypothetical protein [Parabacteroides sp.]
MNHSQMRARVVAGTICPSGWRVPSYADFKDMCKFEDSYDINVWRDYNSSVSSLFDAWAGGPDGTANYWASDDHERQYIIWIERRQYVIWTARGGSRTARCIKNM